MKIRKSCSSYFVQIKVTGLTSCRWKSHSPYFVQMKVTATSNLLTIFGTNCETKSQGSRVRWQLQNTWINCRMHHTDCRRGHPRWRGQGRKAMASERVERAAQQVGKLQNIEWRPWRGSWVQTRTAKEPRRWNGRVIVDNRGHWFWSNTLPEPRPFEKDESHEGYRNR